MSQTNQPVVTNDDPLAQFTNAPQATSSGKFTFNSQEFDSQTSAEAAYNQHMGKMSARIEELERLAQERAANIAPQQTQYASGQEPTGWRHDEWLPSLATDGREAVGNAALAAMQDSKNQFGIFMRRLATEAISARNEVNQIKLRQQHPEVNWNDPKVIQMIDQERQSRGYNTDLNGIEATLLILQRDRRLASPQEFQQQMAAAYQQQNPYQNQNVYQMPPAAPPMFGNRTQSAPSFDEQAALDKMADPNTPLEEVQRIGNALRRIGQNPTQAVG